MITSIPEVPEVIPYIYGRKLYTSVIVAGQEYEYEVDLGLLFKATAGCIDPYDLEQENEALTLIFTLEDGIREINKVLGDDEEEFENV
jgi:hypothetical protein